MKAADSERLLAGFGDAVLAKVHYEEFLGEMKHADTIIQRILFLDGVPNLSDYDRLVIGRTVREQFYSDLALEMAALGVLRPGVRLCLEAGDHATRELLEQIVEDEERHVGCSRRSSTRSKSWVTRIIWRSRFTSRSNRRGDAGPVPPLSGVLLNRAG